MNNKDLKITISCECNQCHDWMAFASWYSIKKQIPDCEVSLKLNLIKPIFRWANIFGIRVSKNSSSEFQIPPTVMAVRDFYGDLNISSSKSNEQTTFVDYAAGCGFFVVDKWLNSNDVPFFRALRRFGSGNLTVNEMAILTLWEKCHYVHLSAGGT
jgi:hypothetical protein